MNTVNRRNAEVLKQRLSKGFLLTSVAAAVLSASGAGLSQTATASEENQALEEIVVTGIRGSLSSALAEKRSSDNLVEVIIAEDIGKLPDQNLAEVLENITGIQITRTGGVGTGVQIRGTSSNRTEINGVSTVGSGSATVGPGSGSRSMNFEDISAGIIAGVEVTKAPEAKTIEGSVGGTINLRTIRPLDLDERLGSIRIQGEDSSLTTDGITPRFSGAFGDKWSNDAGEFGFVGSLSYSEQDVTAFRPRVDRDNLVASDGGAASAQAFDFLPIQFLIQDYDNFEYETTNFAGSFEWAPNDSVKLYFDAVVTDQARRQESSRVQASGVSDLRNFAVPDEFETVNFGSLEGSNGVQQLGTIQAALRGVIPIEDGDADPNLRLSSDTNSRQTDSTIFSIGADWSRGALSGKVQLSRSDSDSATPNFNTTLNFINPNAAVNSSNENGTPFEYDLRGGSLTFGIASNAVNGPSTAQLLDPSNYVLRDVSIQDDRAENSEDAFVADFTYDLDWNAITSLDFGYRRSEVSSFRDQVRSNVSLRSLADSPRGNLFSNALIAGPDNFNAADGRTLFVSDFLVVDPELAISSPETLLATLNSAIVSNNAITGSTRAPISEATSSTAAFYDISEDTNALYAQANFEAGIFRGNFGVRYLETDVTSIGNTVLNGVVSPTTSTSSYDFLLPRINLVANVTEDVVLRAAWSKDIRRPDFSNLSAASSFSTSPNPGVALGNPALEPEEVTSFEFSAGWYFAPASLVSIGYFSKTRKGLFVQNNESPFEDPVTGFRDTSAPCEQGGIFNPIADINVFGPVPGVGVCVPSSQTINGDGETKQTGIELSFQYDLSGFEDQLGWASGFGLIANYTVQDFEGPDSFLSATSRASAVFNSFGASNVDFQQPLIDLSENSYNLTAYYEKYGLSARLRYTWREAYRSIDFGSTSSFPWGFPVIQEDRGQLNASISYEVNEHLTLGIEGVNLTESEVEQSCVNEGALLCYQGLTDRRITFGASYNF